MDDSNAITGNNEVKNIGTFGEMIFNNKQEKLK
jgi:hypothetical protein